jgi:hypothetical protein
MMTVAAIGFNSREVRRRTGDYVAFLLVVLGASVAAISFIHAFVIAMASR